MESYSYQTGSRWPGMVIVIGLHVAVLAFLLTYQPARQMLGLSKPLMVEFITPPAPPVPEPPKEQPKPREVEVVKRKPEPVKPQPLIAATTPTPSPMVAEQPPEPPKPAPPIEAAAPAPPAPPAPPAAPRVISGVEYVRKPAPVYPALSRRMNEQGRVTLRVLISTQGKPEKVDISKSSGFARLDEAARAAVMDALFKPYTDNGKPEAVIATVPISFSLDN
jgi:protein TonB